MTTDKLTLRISEDLLLAIHFAAQQRGLKHTDDIRNTLAGEYAPFINAAKEAAKEVIQLNKAPETQTASPA